MSFSKQVCVDAVLPVLFLLFKQDHFVVASNLLYEDSVYDLVQTVLGYVISSFFALYVRESWGLDKCKLAGECLMFVAEQMAGQLAQLVVFLDGHNVAIVDVSDLQHTLVRRALNLAPEPQLIFGVIASTEGALLDRPLQFFCALWIKFVHGIIELVSLTLITDNSQVETPCICHLRHFNFVYALKRLKLAFNCGLRRLKKLQRFTPDSNLLSSCLLFSFLKLPHVVDHLIIGALHMNLGKPFFDQPQRKVLLISCLYLSKEISLFISKVKLNLDISLEKQVVSKFPGIVGIVLERWLVLIC